MNRAAFVYYPPQSDLHCAFALSFIGLPHLTVPEWGAGWNSSDRVPAVDILLYCCCLCSMGALRVCYFTKVAPCAALVSSILTPDLPPFARPFVVRHLRAYGALSSERASLRHTIKHHFPSICMLCLSVCLSRSVRLPMFGRRSDLSVPPVRFGNPKNTVPALEPGPLQHHVTHTDHGLTCAIWCVPFDVSAANHGIGTLTGIILHSATSD